MMAPERKFGGQVSGDDLKMSEGTWNGGGEEERKCFKTIISRSKPLCQAGLCYSVPPAKHRLFPGAQGLPSFPSLESVTVKGK